MRCLCGEDVVYTLPTIHIGAVVRRCAEFESKGLFKSAKERSSAETPIACSIHCSRDQHPELGMSMRGKLSRLLFRIAGLFVCLSVAPGLGGSFYRGKTITIVVGNPGQLTTSGARLFLYMGRYQFRQPNVIVRNMPGGGTMIAAKYVMVLGTRMEPLWDQYFRRYILRSSRDGRMLTGGNLLGLVPQNITAAFFIRGPTHNTRLWRTFEKRQNHRSARPPQWALPVTTFLSSWRKL
jgi:hypothetical protein